MDLLYPRCAGLDVHKDMLMACVRIAGGSDVRQEVKSFATTTSGLLALSDWLASHEVTHVAMEATGSYWKPVWHVLEGSFELALANPAHIKNVPGRKTDVNDAMWIADLMAHGLIRASFVPPTQIMELRDLTRTRKQLVRTIAQNTLRIQKVLEDANLKLSSVVTDILGLTGRKILDAIVAGESRPEVLAGLAHDRIKATRHQMTEALRGRVRDHHRFLVRSHLRIIDMLKSEVAEIEARIGGALHSFRSATELLTTIPGVSTTVAQAVLSEIGLDMTRFPTVQHLISWAGLCPRNDESAGKRRSTRVRPSGSWLKTMLVQAAWSATRKKDSYLRAQFLRLKARRGPKKAVVAVASSILTAIYFMLRNGVEYSDLGPNHFPRSDKARTVKRLVKTLTNLGFHVDLKEAS